MLEWIGAGEPPGLDLIRKGAPVADLLSANQRNTIIAEHLREHLPPTGLTEISSRRWIDGSKPPVRRLFEIALLKGASLRAEWGFSLDFVPHISAGRVKWHRSDKSARFDIIVSGCEFNLVEPCFLFGPAHLAEDLRKLLRHAVALAEETWKKGATIDGMYEIIREKRARYGGLCDISPVFAFLAAKTGDIEASRKELARYIKFHNLDEKEAAKLQKALTASTGA
ncbi:MAG TPA: hypothetical protein VMP11_13750 [Verrucomicrobiae bacterium]|nr:hypothetical protein [Verrucomicrobiae bacterium]